MGDRKAANDFDIGHWRDDERFYRTEFPKYIKGPIDEFSLEIANQPVSPSSLLQTALFESAKVSKSCREQILRLGGTDQFPDVPTGHWAGAAVQALRDLGILKG